MRYSKLIRLTKCVGLCSAVVVVSACGGNSSDEEPVAVVSYTVTATAGTGGSISPASVSVNSGQTTSFTVTATTDYEIDTVSGCNGNLNNNSYTTGAIAANCTVTASFKAVAAAEMLTGVFVDSAVENISYSSATQQGQTNSAGEFSYLAGESVTFNLGELLFPSTAAKAVITPIDILAAGRVDEDAVVNMVRLLLTLDQDADPTNGIQLTDAAANVATADIDFKVSIADFAANTAVQSLVANAGQNTSTTELVSVVAAIEHFNATLAEQDIVVPSIIGAFTEIGRPAAEDQSEAVIIVFLNSGSYYLVEVNNSLYANDFEYGSYDYQLSQLTSSAEVDVNDELGINDAEGLSLQLTVDGFELRAPDVDGFYEFSRVQSDSNSLVGGWLLEEESVVFVFTAEGTFAGMQPFDADGGVGFEWGTYQYNAETEAISFTIEVDTSGETLLSGGAPQTAALNGDTLTLRFSAEDVVELTRIK